MLVKLLTTRAQRAIKDSLIITLPKIRVKTQQGIVRGCIEKLPNGSPFQRFSGIPYAKPPINELRFRSPQKLLKFNQDEIDCTRERDASFHRSMIWKNYVGSEDCLNLNVYVPSTASQSNKLPVMLFVHGGGFVFDSNSRDFYSPEYLLMEDVIVVTINYRFQALGFLCLPSMGISGNATLKDQQMALEWIHENIESFNGNPNSICLFGESAGAASVHLHTLNSKSRSLIKSAICQSNCVLADWMFQRDGQEKTRRLAKLLGAKGNSDEDCLRTLMGATPRQLYENNVKVIDPEELRRNLPFVFKPVVEQESDDAFITMPPAAMIKNQKDQVDIPLMMGLNDGDGMTMGNYYGNKKLHHFQDDNARLIPISLNIDTNTDEAKQLANQIQELYFGDKPIDNKSIAQFVDYMTDFHFTIPQTMANEMHARYQRNHNQFIYEFCYDGELNVFKKLLKMDYLPGACHFDELFYLFNPKVIGMEVARESPAWKMRETMCRLWTNFAKFGDPTPDHNNPLPIKWKPVQHADESTKTVDLDYLKIDKEPQMLTNMSQPRMKFWRETYEKYNSSFMNPKF